jgi:hypothetical protein
MKAAGIEGREAGRLPDDPGSDPVMDALKEVQFAEADSPAPSPPTSRSGWFVVSCGFSLTAYTVPTRRGALDKGDA